MARVVVWFVGVSLVQVDAHQSKLLLQVEMVVHHDPFMVFLRNQREQSFRVHGWGLRLSQVENIESLLKEGGDDLVFFHEEGGGGHSNELHLCVCLQ